MIWIVLAVFVAVVLVGTHAYAYGSGVGRGFDKAQIVLQKWWRRRVGPDGTRWVVVDGHLERLP